MSEFERIVRPFETGLTTPPENVPTAPFVQSKNVVINPGTHASAKTLSGSYSLDVTFYMINKPKEEVTQ